MKRIVILLLMVFLSAETSGSEDAFPLKAKRILFLGDSITHAGEYVNLMEMQFRLQAVHPMPEFINAGLPSENCTGLSEPDHPFPRPNVHERLDRALTAAKADVVVACYGMNDGIYYPFSEERFEKYKAGIQLLSQKVRASGAKLVLLTPPPFDAMPLKAAGKLLPAGSEKFAWFAVYQDYDEVIRKYGQWLVQQKDVADMVVDLHTPISAYWALRRKKDPNFTVAPDGVHCNSEGHRTIAEVVLKAWGIESWVPISDKMTQLSNEKGKLLHDAWLTHIGHQRPGTAAGLPLNEAQAKAALIDEKLRPLIEEARKPVSSSRPSGGGTIYQIHYPSTAGTDELRLMVDYFLWVPENAAKLRGVIVHQHGCGEGACRGGQTAADDLHWQALARKWNCALMGSMYEPREGVNCRLWCDPRKGSERRFLQALDHFSLAADREELQSVPWCLWGHSGGAFWASLMQTMHPNRIVAIWLRSGTAFGYWSKGEIAAPEISAAALQIPVMGNPGLKERDDARFNVAWNGTKAMQEAYLQQGAPFFEFAPDPRTGHECGDSRYLAIPFFDFWLKHRLPLTDGPNHSLRPATEAVGFWTDAMKAKLEEYVSTGVVADSTPPEPPDLVAVNRMEDGRIRITWTATADFESGIQAFAIERDGRQIGQLPEKPVGRYGRALFQTMSYHDTPELPLPVMEFIDTEFVSTAKPPEKSPVYGVRTINSAGLKSAAATAQ